LVEEALGGLTATPVWVPFATTVLGAIFGYSLGVSRDRRSERYKRRVAAAAKLRARAGRRPPFPLGLRPSGTEGVFSDRFADKLDESLSTN
jgi:hypothetical protein